MNTDDLIYVVQNQLEKDFCEHVIEKFKNEGETIDKYKKRFKENWKIELDKAVEKMKEQL